MRTRKPPAGRRKLRDEAFKFFELSTRIPESTTNGIRMTKTRVSLIAANAKRTANIESSIDR
jgi:hypothetical protein